MVMHETRRHGHTNPVRFHLEYIFNIDHKLLAFILVPALSRVRGWIVSLIGCIWLGDYEMVFFKGGLMTPEHIWR